MTQLKLRNLISGDVEEVDSSLLVYVPEPGVEPPTDGNLEGIEGLRPVALGEAAVNQRIVWVQDEQESDGAKLVWPMQVEE